MTAQQKIYSIFFSSCKSIKVFLLFQKVQLKRGGLVFKEWKHSSLPIFMQYFVFNLTNPEEVVAGTAVPNVTQMGPYSYRYISRVSK